MYDEQQQNQILTPVQPYLGPLLLSIPSCPMRHRSAPSTSPDVRQQTGILSITPQSCKQACHCVQTLGLARRPTPRILLRYRQSAASRPIPPQQCRLCFTFSLARPAAEPPIDAQSLASLSGSSDANEPLRSYQTSPPARLPTASPLQRDSGPRYPILRTQSLTRASLQTTPQPQSLPRFLIICAASASSGFCSTGHIITSTACDSAHAISLPTPWNTCFLPWSQPATFSSLWLANVRCRLTDNPADAAILCYCLDFPAFFPLTRISYATDYIIFGTLAA